MTTLSLPLSGSGESLIELGRRGGHDSPVSTTTVAPPFHPHRRRTDRVIAGVAGGLADTLGVRDGYVRAAFVSLVPIWGIGAFAYLLFWLATYDKVEDRPRERVETSQAVGLAIAFAGLMFLLGALGLWTNTVVVLTAAALSFGMAALTDPDSPGPFAALLSPGVEKVGKARLVLGVILLAGGIVMFSSVVGRLFDLSVVFLAVVLTGLGVFVAFGPWVRRLLTDLSAERGERIRQESRAEVAAHLHDSVLQTLALIQRTDDPQRMAMLARHQETELRDWLYGTAPLDGIDLVSTALKQAAARVEADFQVPVEVVTVGDRPVDDRGRALVAAASEAMVNAAKHADADRMSLYLEVDDEAIQVYVTDQGKGFDPQAVPFDRKGISESIRARMEKAGGEAMVESAAGEGTEVMLRLPL